MTLDHLAHLRRTPPGSWRCSATCRTTGRSRPVPDWQADDLLWHLGEVQWFWGTIVRDAVDDPETLQPPDRPADRQGLVTFFDEASAALQRPSPSRPDGAAVDLGGGPDGRLHPPSAGARGADPPRRRGAHRRGRPRPDRPRLASDGVDEALRIMFGGAPPWARLTSTTTPPCGSRTTTTVPGGSRSAGSTAPARMAPCYVDEPAIEVAPTDPAHRLPPPCGDGRRPRPLAVGTADGRCHPPRGRPRGPRRLRTVDRHRHQLTARPSEQDPIERSGTADRALPATAARRARSRPAGLLPSEVHE
jgi:hypothetical protein